VIVTFADGVLKLVRSGARIEVREGARLREQPDGFADAMLIGAEARDAAPAAESFEDAFGGVAFPADAAAGLAAGELGLSDLEAAVELVSAGLATRVVLSGFPTWPGLLWRAYQLADTTGIVILPTVVRPGGRVDIVIARDTAANG
jgi:hypothetical protein